MKGNLFRLAAKGRHDPCVVPRAVPIVEAMIKLVLADHLLKKFEIYSMKKPSLPVQIIIGLVLGIAWALLSSSMGWSDFTIDWIAPFGTIFINLLKLIAIPLVLFSIIAGIGNLSDTATLGRMGVKTLALYIGSTVLAAAMGMLIANTFNPESRLLRSN